MRTMARDEAFPGPMAGGTTGSRLIMHKTNAHWEAGAVPGPELIERVGAMVGELSQAGILQGAEGLRPCTSPPKT